MSTQGLPHQQHLLHCRQVGKGKKDMQAMQRITIALARTPVVNLPSWRPQRKVLLNPSWWEMVWLACAKFYGTVAHLEESFTRARTQEPAQQSANSQVSPPPLRKRRKCKGSNNTHRKHTSFFHFCWCMAPSAHHTHTRSLFTSWWEMMWLACTKFYGTVAHLEESFTRARTQEPAQKSATSQVSPPPISGKEGSTKAPTTPIGNTPLFCWCMAPLAHLTHKKKATMCREHT